MGEADSFRCQRALLRGHAKGALPRDVNPGSRQTKLPLVLHSPAGSARRLQARPRSACGRAWVQSNGCFQTALPSAAAASQVDDLREGGMCGASVIP
jgi:hypothetical protein